MTQLNLFYAEPDLDRWLPFDRLPRKLIRRVLRGPHRPGGQMRVFLNLVTGLKLIGVPHRVNDHRYAARHPDKLCCILGKRCVLDSRQWENPLMIGPCVFDHPTDCPDLFEKWRVRRLLVPGMWMRKMCEPLWGEQVFDWPVGIDTHHWSPAPENKRDIDVLVYDKLRWNRDIMVPRLLTPILSELERRNLNYVRVQYGNYAPDHYRDLLGRARRMVFLCEHETQGIAYQEALSSGVPVIAWDHAGAWTDPNYYPDKINFSPVSSVPYWDDRCGIRFQSAEFFPDALDKFEAAFKAGLLNPRAYILENLTLEKCATAFVHHAKAAQQASNSPSHPLQA